MLPRRFKKNLKQLYILHPTKWIEAVTKIMTTSGVSKKFFQKIHYLQTIAELQKSLQPMPTLPKFVHDEDVVRVQKLRDAEAGHANNAKAASGAMPPQRQQEPLGLVFGRPLVG